MPLQSISLIKLIVTNLQLMFHLEWILQTGETASLFTKCDMTVTFHKMKQGIPKRKDLTGELFAEKIGIPPEAEIDVL